MNADEFQTAITPVAADAIRESKTTPNATLRAARKNVSKIGIFRSEQALSHSYKIGPDPELGVSYFLESRLTTKLTGL